MTQWQPIKTAPKDGSDVLIYAPLGNPSTVHGIALARFNYVDDDGNEWWHDGADAALNPTHWMPLPPLP